MAGMKLALYGSDATCSALGFAFTMRDPFEVFVGLKAILLAAQNAARYPARQLRGAARRPGARCVAWHSPSPATAALMRATSHGAAYLMEWGEITAPWPRLPVRRRQGVRRLTSHRQTLSPSPRRGKVCNGPGGQPAQVHRAAHLSKDHDRNEFDGGGDLLNGWFRRHAWANHVSVPGQGDPQHDARGARARQGIAAVRPGSSARAA